MLCVAKSDEVALGECGLLPGALALLLGLLALLSLLLDFFHKLYGGGRRLVGFATLPLSFFVNSIF